MFLFMILGLPLAFATLVIRAYPAEELAETKRSLIRGLIFSIPLWFLARFLGGLLPPFWGSPLVVLHEFLDRALSYGALPLAGYALFWRFDEKIETPRFVRRLTAFYVACLAPMGLGEMTRSLLAPDFYSLFLLPLLLATLALALPLFVRTWMETWTSRRVLLGLGAAAALLVLSSSPWFLGAHNVLVPILVIGGSFALALLKTLPLLTKRSPRPAS